MISNGGKRFPVYIKEVIAKAALYIDTLAFEMIPLFLDLTHLIIFQKSCTALQASTGMKYLLGKRKNAVGNFLSQFTDNEYHLDGRKAESCWLEQVWFVPDFSCVLKRDTQILVWELLESIF